MTYGYLRSILFATLRRPDRSIIVMTFDQPTAPCHSLQLAPQVGLEPTPSRLTAERNTFLLPWNNFFA